MGNAASGFGMGFADFFAGLGRGIKDTFTGIFTGNFDYNDASTSFENVWNDLKSSAWINPDGSQGRDWHIGRSLDNDELNAQKQKQIQAIYDPNSTWNKGNWQSVSATTRGAHYGTSRGNGGVTPPSQIMSISNPNVKQAISVTRGRQRASLNVLGSAMDASASHVFTAPPAQTSAEPSSGVVASAGGAGPATSVDVNNNQFDK